MIVWPTLLLSACLHNPPETPLPPMQQPVALLAHTLQSVPDMAQLHRVSLDGQRMWLTGEGVNFSELGSPTGRLDDALTGVLSGALETRNGVWTWLDVHGMKHEGFLLHLSPPDASSDTARWNAALEGLRRCRCRHRHHWCW